MKEEITLVAVKADVRDGEKHMRAIVHNLEESHQVLAISSIYGVQNFNEYWNEWDRGLSVAIKVMTQQSADEFFETLSFLERKLQKEALRKVFKVYLLCYGHQVELSKKINLPHPELHRKPELLIPASEIYGEYQHPVLHEGLRSLSKPYAQQKWGEFFAQGKILREGQI